MSAVEFGLTSQLPLVNAASQVPFEPAMAELERSEIACQSLPHFSRSIASVAPEILSYNLAALVRPVFPCDLANILIIRREADDVHLESFGARELTNLPAGIEETTVWSVYQDQIPLWISDWHLDERSAVQKEALSVEGAEYRSLCRLPLSTPDGCLGVLSFACAVPHAFTEKEIRLLSLAAERITVAVENFLLQAELRKLKTDSAGEEIDCQSEASGGQVFDDMVGRSKVLHNILRNVKVVAPTDSGVLIQGETGTGKELVARAIHNRSARHAQPFVKVNCAAIPSGLLESELFGHEKGAFTGAVIRKAGRFEVADKGTLFLDEVGDIPLDLQSKLLRVLQEHEFERLGSTRTQRVDVRVVAATHRDLKQMVEEGTFRSDLYYRLHVFPLMVPPLRERREDIPLLVRHFVNKYAQRNSRRIDKIPSRTMEVLASYPWPGNVRELEHFVERAVILSPSNCLVAPLDELKPACKEGAFTTLSTLKETEREHVLRALNESNWVTGGPNGAAVRLGMKRTTLAYRIRKLGIPPASLKRFVEGKNS